MGSRATSPSCASKTNSHLHLLNTAQNTVRSKTNSSSPAPQTLSKSCEADSSGRANVKIPRPPFPNGPSWSVCEQALCKSSCGGSARLDKLLLFLKCLLKVHPCARQRCDATCSNPASKPAVKTGTAARDSKCKQAWHSNKDSVVHGGGEVKVVQKHAQCMFRQGQSAYQHCTQIKILEVWLLRIRMSAINQSLIQDASIARCEKFRSKVSKHHLPFFRIRREGSAKVTSAVSLPVAVCTAMPLGPCTAKSARQRSRASSWAVPASAWSLGLRDRRGSDSGLDELKNYQTLLRSSLHLLALGVSTRCATWPGTAMRRPTVRAARPRPWCGQS